MGPAASLQVTSGVHIVYWTIKESHLGCSGGPEGNTLAVEPAAHNGPAATVCACAAALLPNQLG